VATEVKPSIDLELVAPSGRAFEGSVDMVVVPGVMGEFGILPHHAPIVASLAIGSLRVQERSGTWLTFAVANGFVKVQDNKVIVLASSAEEASSIDVERAQKALEEAQSRLELVRQNAVPEDEDVDPYLEELAISKAKNRLKIAGVAQKHA